MALVARLGNAKQLLIRGMGRPHAYQVACGVAFSKARN